MKILYIMSTFNIYGGTPKKTLDLLRYFQKDASLYVYDRGYQEFKPLFEQTGASIYEGNYGRNLFRHISAILKIIDKKNINIVQTQFSMGEILGYFIKLLRPHIKLIVAFVSSAEPQDIKKIIIKQIYKKVDSFVFISEYVKKEKTAQFLILNEKESNIIYNGSNKRVAIKENEFEIFYPSLVAISGLTKIKNISILINAIYLIQTKTTENIHLYVVGDGPERLTLEAEIKQKNLTDFIHLIGYQENVGELLEKSDIFVHPCYMEGFGISVVEAMMANKPIIVSNAGALPELIENDKSGLVVEPFNAKSWANAILKLINDKKYAKTLGEEARKRAKEEFSIDKYIENYRKLYKILLDVK